MVTTTVGSSLPVCSVPVSGKETQKNSTFPYGKYPPFTLPRNKIVIDSSSRRNLELVETMREKQKEVFWVLTRPKQLWEPEHFVLCGTASDRCRGNRKEIMLWKN